MCHQYALISGSHVPVTIHPSQDIDMFTCADSDSGSDGLIISNGCYNAEAAQPAHTTPATVDINPFLLDDCEPANTLAAAMEGSSVSILVSAMPLPLEYKLPEKTYAVMPNLPLDLSFMQLPEPTTLAEAHKLISKQCEGLDVYMR